MRHILKRQSLSLSCQRLAARCLSDDGRRTLTPEVLKEIKQENDKTLQSINTKLYRQLYKSIEQAEASNYQPPEYGPRQTYQYQWATTDDGLPVYQRVQQGQVEDILTLKPDQNVIDMSLSQDEQILAYLLDNDEVWLTHLELGMHRRIHKGQYSSIVVGPQEPEKDCYSIYAVKREEGRPSVVCVMSVFHNTLAPTPPMEVYRETNPQALLSIQRSKAGKHLIIDSLTQDSNEVRMLRHLHTELELVRAREANCHYFIDVDASGVVFLLLRQRNNTKIIELDSSELPLTASFDECSSIQSSTGFDIENMELFRDFIVLLERSTLDASQRFSVINRRTRKRRTLNLEATPVVSKLSFENNSNYDSTSVSIAIDSPVRSKAIQTLPLDIENTNQFYEKAHEESESFIETKRLFVGNGCVEVPLSVVYDSKAIADRDCINVCLIGYGCYGENIDISYNPSLVPLLEHGVALAYAHTRGGAERGIQWHHDGRRGNRQNAIDDFLACSLFLREHFGDTRVSLTAKGFSGGGIMVAAAVNQAPTMFQKLILTNSFLDLSHTMRQPNLHLTQHEYSEFGDPSLPQMARELSRLCPVTNIPATAKNFPITLVVGTLDDQQVPYWNSWLYGKRLRDAGANVNILLDGTGGHHLVGNRKQIAALEAEFILRET